MYQCYALKDAERDMPACQFFYREASHAPLTLHYYVWLILGGPHPLLVDTGFLPGDARGGGGRGVVGPPDRGGRGGVRAGARGRRAGGPVLGQPDGAGGARAAELRGARPDRPR